jgi:translation initiation factor 2 subunit 2
MSLDELEVRLVDKPLCAQVGSCVAIEKRDGKQWVLCAHGKIVGGTQCHSGKNMALQSGRCDAELLSNTQIAPVLQHPDLSENFVNNFLSDMASGSASGQTSISEDMFDLHREGKASFLWRNFVSVMENFGREPSLFVEFLKGECNLDGALAGSDRRMLRVQFRGYGLKDRLQGLLERFVDSYVTCRQCGSQNTHLEPKSLRLECCSCKATCFAEVVTPQLNIPALDDPACRYKMPALEVQIRGSGKMIRTVIRNITDVADALCIADCCKESNAISFMSTPESILRFFSHALGTDADPGTKSVGGAHTTSKLQEVLRVYIDDFVCCPKCHLPEMDLRFEKGGNISGCCRACSWQGCLALTRNHSKKLAEQLFKKTGAMIEQREGAIKIEDRL